MHPAARISQENLSESIKFYHICAHSDVKSVARDEFLGAAHLWKSRPSGRNSKPHKGLNSSTSAGHNGMMATVVQLIKRLTLRPDVTDVPGVTLRHFAGLDDVEPWLRLRELAFARQQVGVRRWTLEDFRDEMLDKPWWSNERMWLAETMSPAGNRLLIGSVTWADRATATETRAAVHWLAVAPAWRRRNVGRLLMSALEASCWDAGHHQIWLETHTAWRAAAEFYERLGYSPT